MDYYHAAASTMWFYYYIRDSTVIIKMVPGTTQADIEQQQQQSRWCHFHRPHPVELSDVKLYISHTISISNRVILFLGLVFIVIQVQWRTTYLSSVSSSISSWVLCDLYRGVQHTKYHQTKGFIDNKIPRMYMKNAKTYEVKVQLAINHHTSK